MLGAIQLNLFQVSRYLSIADTGSIYFIKIRNRFINFNMDIFIIACKLLLKLTVIIYHTLNLVIHGQQL